MPLVSVTIPCYPHVKCIIIIIITIMHMHFFSYARAHAHVCTCAHLCPPHMILKVLPMIHFYGTVVLAVTIGGEQYFSIRDQLPFFFKVLHDYFRWLPPLLPFHNVFILRRDFSVSQVRFKQHCSFWVVY